MDVRWPPREEQKKAESKSGVQGRVVGREDSVRGSRGWYGLGDEVALDGSVIVVVVLEVDVDVNKGVGGMGAGGSLVGIDLDVDMDVDIDVGAELVCCVSDDDDDDDSSSGGLFHHSQLMIGLSIVRLSVQG